MAAIDDDEVVADALDFAEQVGGHDDGDAELAARAPHEVEHLVAARGVEAVRRLVEQHHAGVVDERLGELDALLHARRVAADLAVALLEQADVPQRFGGAFAGGGAGQAVDLGHVRDELRRAHIDRQAVVLGHVANVLAELGALRRGRRSPAAWAEPLVGGSSPSRILMSVLLPAPFAPTSPMMPGSSSIERLSSAVTAG